NECPLMSTGCPRASVESQTCRAPIQVALGTVPVASRRCFEIRRRSPMHVTRRQVTLGGLSLLASAALRAPSLAHVGDFLGLGEGLEDFGLAVDAYIYGSPLVTMEYTRRIMTNVAAPEGNRGPMGQFIKAREYPNASFRDVTAPNADT